MAVPVEVPPAAMASVKTCFCVLNEKTNIHCLRRFPEAGQSRSA